MRGLTQSLLGLKGLTKQNHNGRNCYPQLYATNIVPAEVSSPKIIAELFDYKTIMFYSFESNRNYSALLVGFWSAAVICSPVYSFGNKHRISF